MSSNVRAAGIAEQRFIEIGTWAKDRPYDHLSAGTRETTTSARLVSHALECVGLVGVNKKALCPRTDVQARGVPNAARLTSIERDRGLSFNQPATILNLLPIQIGGMTKDVVHGFAFARKTRS